MTIDKLLAEPHALHEALVLSLGDSLPYPEKRFAIVMGRLSSVPSLNNPKGLAQEQSCYHYRNKNRCADIDNSLK